MLAGRRHSPAASEAGVSCREKDEDSLKIIRVWKAPKNEHGARYVTVDENGKLIYAYKKLADIRKAYKVELELHFVELKRELDHTWSADGK